MIPLLSAHWLLIVAIVLVALDARFAAQATGHPAVWLSRRGLEPSQSILAHYVMTGLLWLAGLAFVCLAAGVPTIPVVVISVLTAALGFALNPILGNVINGFYLMAEGRFQPGDTITLNGNPDESGVFVRYRLRSIELQRPNGDVAEVPHSTIIADILTIHHPSKETPCQST